MSEFAELKAEFAKFDGLPIGEATSKQRKAIVRSIESAIRNGTVALTNDQLRQCRDGDATLGRIVAYLYVENERVKSVLADRRNDVVAEWERLQRARFAPGTSTMPLHYAVRSYLTSLKGTTESAIAAQVDRTLFEQIAQSLLMHRMDPGKQVQRAIEEITSLIDKGSSSESHPTVVAAYITSRRAIIAALIAALVALAVGILANWDKLSTRTEKAR